MSEDILSGGAIDQSTSGPTPPSTDDRDRDILLEQKEKQDQDAIGGTQFPPTPQPPPPIPQAPEVAPPLPEFSFFDSNIAGADFESTREIARQAVVDVLKNVTINGQGPAVEGSTIAFNVSQELSASEAFASGSPRIPSRIGAADFGQGQSLVESQPSRIGAEDFGQGQSLVDSQPSRIDAEDFGRRSVMDENRPSGEVRAERPEGTRASGMEGFDRESSIRQRGESQTEFRERQEELRQERAERAQREEQIKRVRDGDLTEMPSGMIPVRLTRADGQKKILALMSTELVGVVEGATGGERTLPLPAEDSYYEGGGGADQTNPWDLIVTPIAGQNQSWEIRVAAGTLNGLLPSNWNSVFNASGNTIYYAKAIIETDGESITGLSISFDTSPPQNQTPQKFKIQSNIQFLFGVFSGGQKFRTIGTGTLTLTPRVWLTLSSDPPAQAGRSPYDLYYRLQT